MNDELIKIIKYDFSIFGNKAIDRIKIDHYSWSEDSIYRYFDKKLVNESLMRSVEIAVENEFLRWDDEASKKFVIEGLSFMRTDKNILSHDAWTDTVSFENAAIETLKLLVAENKESDITETVRKVEGELQNLRQSDNKRFVQVYERILYELNECTLREFAALKTAVLSGDKY